MVVETVFALAVNNAIWVYFHAKAARELMQALQVEKVNGLHQICLYKVASATLSKKQSLQHQVAALSHPEFVANMNELDSMCETQWAMLVKIKDSKDCLWAVAYDTVMSAMTNDLKTLQSAHDLLEAKIKLIQKDLPYDHDLFLEIYQASKQELSRQHQEYLAEVQLEAQQAGRLLRKAETTCMDVLAKVIPSAGTRFSVPSNGPRGASTIRKRSFPSRRSHFLLARWRLLCKSSKVVFIRLLCKILVQMALSALSPHKMCALKCLLSYMG
jgi:hypothetical protein